MVAKVILWFVTLNVNCNVILDQYLMQEHTTLRKMYLEDVSRFMLIVLSHSPLFIPLNLRTIVFSTIIFEYLLLLKLKRYSLYI